MIAFTIFSFAIISFAISDPISFPPPFLSQGGRKILHEIAPEEPDVNSFQLAGRSKREASAQRAEAAPAPDIPGVTCSLGRKKREAQSGDYYEDYEIAYAPAPDIDLPPCSG